MPFSPFCYLLVSSILSLFTNSPENICDWNLFSDCFGTAAGKMLTSPETKCASLHWILYICTTLMTVFIECCQAKWAFTSDLEHIPFQLSVCSSSFPFYGSIVIMEVSCGLKPCVCTWSGWACGNVASALHWSNSASLQPKGVECVTCASADSLVCSCFCFVFVCFLFFECCN